MRIIATVTNDSLGLIEENEILNATTELKEILVELKYAKIYDDTKPRVGKSINIYEVGMSYPPERQVFFNDSIYVSLINTTRAPLTDAEVLAQQSPDTEWEKLTTGKNAL